MHVRVREGGREGESQVKCTRVCACEGGRVRLSACACEGGRVRERERESEELVKTPHPNPDLHPYPQHKFRLQP